MRNIQVRHDKVSWMTIQLNIRDTTFVEITIPALQFRRVYAFKSGYGEEILDFFIRSHFELYSIFKS